jgi:Gluconate 2-dehydrogenase subunit 3
MIGGGLGALAPTGLEAAHPVHRHLASSEAIDAARQTAGAADWKPVFLSTHQSATLEAVAERMVPGSTQARVNRFVDKLLGVETEETQRRFLESLSAFEGAALQQFGRPFLKLTEAERDAVLAALSTRSPSAPDAPAGQPGPNPSSPFADMKGWVSGAYYSSEIGMRELGWTGNTFFEKFPGCTHPGGHD